MNNTRNVPSQQEFEEMLDDLHRQGLIERLVERRDGLPVYVTPKHLDGRATEPWVPRAS